MNKKYRDNTKTMLDETIVAGNYNPAVDLDKFREYLRGVYPNEHNMKGVVCALAEFSYENGLSKVFSKSYQEKLDMKFNREVASVYSDLARDYLLLCK